MDTYKKKYEDAFQIAIVAHKDEDRHLKATLERIFPELAESEDEKIRKELLEHCKNQAEPYIQTGNEYPQIQSWITWLEKQGDKDKLIKELGEYKVKYCNMKYSQCKFESNDVVKCLINGMKFYYEDNEEATWGTEKFSMKVKDILTWLETQGEHKAEPKFHKGDWCIDNEDGVIFQIVKVLDNTYTYKTNEGKEYSCSHYSLENDAHLWTIQDAKDGDVIVFKNNICGIIICKSPTDYDTRSYCRFVSDNFINKEESGWDSTLLVPATKEQHDLLFQKIKEAGYVWDAEKLELKKIEKKPTDKVEPKFKVGDKIYLKPEYRMPDDDTPIANTVKEIIRIDDKHYKFDGSYIFIEDQDKYELVKQKPAWTEKDDVMLKDMISILKDSGYTAILKDPYINWLKSLKERIN